MEIHSWGKYPVGAHREVTPVYWREDLNHLAEDKGSWLPYGQGLSYGDSCLNFGNHLLLMRKLDHMISFDERKGILRCEAGVTLDEILRLIVPKGWFLPVTPGTKYITVGGAIANDVHGKDHHMSGTFGCYVRELELWRSDHSITTCSPRLHSDLYAATIGGLGLTGAILAAEIQLIPIKSAFLDVEYIRYGSLDEFFEISADSNASHAYSVAWIDCLYSKGENLGRGIFMRGNFSRKCELLKPHPVPPAWLQVPVDAPGFCVTPLTMKAFNTLYYHKQTKKHSEKLVHYGSFFYPLDVIKSWNRCYGKSGFFQYQFVIPSENGRKNIHEILKAITKSGMGSFLAVLKTFGDVPSPGMLSFPKPGITLALDFPNKGKKTLELFRILDQMVLRAGGRLYPAKDARMSGDVFRNSYDNLSGFQTYLDPKFSSSFWRRVNS